MIVPPSKVFCILASLLLLSYGGTVSTNAQVISLPNAVRMMLEHEPELNAVEYDTLSSIEDIKINRASRLPQVSVNGSAGVVNRDRSTDGLFRSGDTLLQQRLGLSLRQLLYDGGISRNQVEASKNAEKAQQYLEKGMIEDRVVDLAETYMEVIRIRSAIANAESNIDTHQKYLKMMNTRADHGGVRTDIKLVQSRLNEAKQSISSLRHEENNAKARFAYLTGNHNYHFITPPVPTIPNQIESVSLENNWNYLAAAEVLEEVEHRAKAAKGEYAPQFYFDAGYNRGENLNGVRGNDNEVSAMIVGELKLFDGGRRKALNKRHHYQVGKHEELKRAANQNRVHSLELLWQERMANQESMALLSERTQNLSAIIGDFENQFPLGKIDLIKILDRQNEYFQAKSQLINARFDHKASAYRISGLQGNLSEWLLSLAENGSSGSKTPIQDPIPVALVDDERVPLTQEELMLRAFQEEGPSTNYEPAPMEAYYNQPTNSRPGIFKPSYFERKKQKTVSPYVYEQAGVENPASVIVKPAKKQTTKSSSTKKRKFLFRLRR